jgi:hypothetical protein
VRRSRVTVFAAGLLLAAPCFSRAAAVPAPQVVPVIGRAATPNAFQPALPCTLMLIAPGSRLIGRGLMMSADPNAVPTANGDFAYLPFGPDDYSFDQVNVFRHAQRFLERLQRYGLDLDEFPIYLRVQHGIGSFTNQSEPNTTIGTGLNGRNPEAKDSDIIVHELTHAVFNPRMPLDQYPLDKGESLPVAEGLADYFAAVVNGDTHIGEYASPPDGYHDIATDSTIYNYVRWDALPADPYARGRVLNGALLTLRRAIGETADELVFAALDHRPLRCMPCFADAMRWSDNERYGGVHLAAINAAFATRGISGGPPSQVSITGPAYMWTGDTATFRLHHHCGMGPFTADWFTSQDGGATWQPLPGSADSVAVTPAVPFLIEATLREQRGGETAAPPPSLIVYRSDDPALRFHGVHIRGPATVPPNQSVSFTAALDGGNGVAPVLYQWTVQGGRLVGPNNQSSVAVVPALGTIHLSVLHADAAGQSERDSLAVPVDLGTRVVRAVHIQGPATLDPSQPVTYTFALDGGPGFDPIHIHWDIAGGRFVGPHEDLASVAIAPAGSMPRLSVVYTDAAGQSVTDTLAIPVDVGNRRVLGIHLQGPLVLEPAQAGSYTFALDGGPGFAPLRLHWASDGGRFSGAHEDVSAIAISPVDGPFRLTFVYSDAAGQSVTDTLAVQMVQRLNVSIAGPDVVAPGHSARFTAAVAGGLPPYRFQWTQSVPGATVALPDGPEALIGTSVRTFSLVLSATDQRGVVQRDTNLVVVAPTVPTDDQEATVPLVFRALGSVVRRGGPITFEIPDDAAGGSLAVLDLAGRVLLTRPIASDGGTTATVVLPRSLEAGVYFARLVRPACTRVTRFVVVLR